MTDSEKEFTRIGQELNTKKSQMFGKACFKTGKKAYISFFQDCMVFKLKGDAHSEALSLDKTLLFDPSGKGRAMKEWVQVPFEYKEKWNYFAKSALEYVNELNK